MNWNVLAALAVVSVGGVAVAVQAPVNSALSRAIGNNLFAATISFGVGFVLLLALSTARGAVPTLGDLRAAPWWAWLGGVLGALYVWSAIYSVPKLGVVTMIATLILGQLVGAIVLDAIGAFGLPVKEIGWQRILAIVMVAGGVILSRL
ncbi:MAG TPA: DMT family transporter [Amaricoccus sp.]|uniref:DMT family transporter n=1 Tax=Amaricoccus sp. TaxID=1872485 RepID=UPI001DAEC54F|nr:DMT family transporter [Amaricoccus sp.]MCB1369532.1 DMT family transporter [Paracoccaceae bacterium]MCC0065779.1 DMT family transporter [Rhodovulum sp.]MCB1372934.1 DMT family transporter [Paracoccaceae bacterium]MCB1404591.1 DMT family transporter [Paracoccaceae bacterium]HPG21565.1 DMT family transporter [Amaricoccus sp.]